MSFSSMSFFWFTSPSIGALSASLENIFSRSTYCSSQYQNGCPLPFHLKNTKTWTSSENHKKWAELRPKWPQKSNLAIRVAPRLVALNDKELHPVLLTMRGRWPRRGCDLWRGPPLWYPCWPKPTMTRAATGRLVVIRIWAWEWKGQHRTHRQN